MSIKIQTPPITSGQKSNQLGSFIRNNIEAIIQEWASFAKTLAPNDMTILALRDHAEEILEFIADDLDSFQTNREQVIKSRGRGPKEGGMRRSAAEIHADLRLQEGFNLDQMVSEYRALRASVIKLWTAKNPELTNTDFQELNRFNEAIDQAMTESISHYTKQIDHSRNMFLGILGHDLRNPIGAASMSAQLMVKLGTIDAKHTILAAQIINSTARASMILTDLLDLTRAGFGSDLPIIKDDMDMGVLSKELVDELQAFYAGREIIRETSGEMRGKWDRIRIGQVFSNLIGNTIQYSPEDTPVQVTLKGEPDEVILSVHNQGAPIPADKIGRIFDSLTRGGKEGEEHAGSANLGLGLYITKKIALAHGGTIHVTSNEKEGTTFTVRLPRQ